MPCRLTVGIFAALLLSVPIVGRAQEAIRSSMAADAPPAGSSEESYRSPSELKKLSLEQLADVEITSASRRPEPISQASSAIDVVTGDEIYRFGATNIPDALRLAAGMEVAQIDGHTWAISARGFNNTAANKLQVLMDGRSLYTPLFSGVFWDVQRTFLPDLEQIEVIRGPGATLWGANAVNGVINIRSKSAKDTQGFLVDLGGGEDEGYAGIRYGGRIGADTYYRAYVMYQGHDSLTLTADPRVAPGLSGDDAGDETRFTQGGFRVDSYLSHDDTVTIQGDGYAGTFGQFNAPDVEVDGGNIIGRWTHELGGDSSIMLQTYYDRTHRLIPNVFEEHRSTFDLELQGRFVVGQHDIVYGAEYRLSADDIGNLGPSLAFLPDERTVHLISGYVQDEWHIIPHKFSLAAGSKFEWNSFSGFEIQPTGRFTWTPTTTQTLWGAISRAVRTPTRIDQDLFSPNPANGQPILGGNSNFEPETVIAYELGYRIEPTRTLSFDLSAYYNNYDKLRSIQSSNNPPPLFFFGNGESAETYGGTLALQWRVTDWWKVDGSVSALHLDFHRAPGSADPQNGNDPDYWFNIRSSLDLPWNLQFDSVLRYVDDLPNPPTPSYLTLDLRLAWSPKKNFELAVVGRNLLQAHHAEFSGTLTHEVDRTVFATLRWKY